MARRVGGGALAALLGCIVSMAGVSPGFCGQPESDGETLLSVFLCGDFMTGRGIDQAFPRSVDPTLHEPYVKDARAYVRLAERRSGLLPEAMSFEYVWGDALAVLRRFAPDVRIVNLETAVTSRGRPWEGKGIHYRMHPENVAVLTVADIDCAVLANNHILDWGYEGLTETLDTLARAGVRTVGAGIDRDAAERPAVFPCAEGTRVLVYGCGSPSGGVPRAWEAGEKRGGVNVLSRLSEAEVDRIGRSLAEIRQPRDITIVSIHWGGNWGYDIADEQIEFAHRLIDEADVHIVHGHSSHHPKAFEVYRDRLILYGCGDLLNDYEGIGGYESYRPDLSVMYFPVYDTRRGSLVELSMVPMRVERFRLNRASQPEAEWLMERLNREGRRFGVQIDLKEDRTLVARW